MYLMESHWRLFKGCPCVFLFSVIYPALSSGVSEYNLLHSCPGWHVCSIWQDEKTGKTWWMQQFDTRKPWILKPPWMFFSCDPNTKQLHSAKERETTKKSQLWIKLMKVSSHLCLLQAMMWAAQRTARCTPTGTSGSRNHAESVSVTTVRFCVTRSSVMSWVTVRRWWSLRESAAPCVRQTHPTAVEQTPSVSKKDSSVCLHSLP